jgi:hypothetical protein
LKIFKLILDPIYSEALLSLNEYLSELSDEESKGLIEFRDAVVENRYFVSLSDEAITEVLQFLHDSWRSDAVFFSDGQMIDIEFSDRLTAICSWYWQIHREYHLMLC